MANIQARAVECVSLQVSPTIGGLVDAFLGKSVEQIMAIQLLGAIYVQDFSCLAPRGACGRACQRS